MVYWEERSLLDGIGFPIPCLENLHIGLGVKTLQRTTLNASYSSVAISSDGFEDDDTNNMETN